MEAFCKLYFTVSRDLQNNDHIHLPDKLVAVAASLVLVLVLLLPTAREVIAEAEATFLHTELANAICNQNSKLGTRQFFLVSRRRQRVKAPTNV